MSTKDHVPLKGHEYDGIKEFDNPLPRWWVITFLATIIFSFIYFIHYHTETKRLIADEYQSDLQTLQKSGASDNKSITPESLKAAALDPSQLEKGKGVFSNKCATCHAPDGGGAIGPNLCDNFWINGKGRLEDIAATIKDGVPDKGMPAWGSMIGQDEVIQVAVYVASLRNTKPTSPKAPQGQKVD